MKKKFKQKLFSIFLSFILIFQYLFSILINIPAVHAQPALTANLELDSTTNNFTLSVDTSETVDYFLAYKTDSEIEGVSGSDQGNPFSKEIYAGTCSETAGVVCIPHNVIRGILKVQVSAASWSNTQWFTVNSPVEVVLEKEGYSSDLSPEEFYWLQDGEEIPPVVINEFLPDPQTGGPNNEFIELFNKGEELVDISGWQLDDEEGGSSPYSIPNGTTISSGEFLVFYKSETNIGLNNDIDSVRLLHGDSLVDQYDYEDTTKGSSYNRCLDGEDNWQELTTPTPGEPNACSGIGGSCDHLNGAIWTTNDTCGGVDLNLYNHKEDVYLNGGPQHNGGSGLPDGEYYVKVTEPNGTLLGNSGTETITVTDGNLNCVNLFSLTNFADTTNPGGEYKVWLSPDPEFPEKCSKTDNFKVVGEGDLICEIGPVFQIGDIEANQMDNPVDELNWPGMFGNFPPFPDPFIVGVNSDSEYPWNSNYNKGYATDFDVQFDYAGADAAVAQLTISWSPGASANERKEVLLDGVSIGTTPVRFGHPVAGWWEQMERFEEHFTFPLTFGTHTLTFKHLYGDGTLWDYVKLEIISCEEEPTGGSISGTKFNDHNGNGEKEENDEGLPGWTIKAVVPEPVATVEVDSTNPNGINTSNLPAGPYLVRAVGDWRGAAGEQNRVDAEYITHDWWQTYQDGVSEERKNQGDLLINDNFYDWGPYNTGHIYYLNFTQEQEGPINFSVFDGNSSGKVPSWYDDNSGTITVYVYKVIDETVTDGSGNYQLNIPAEYSHVLVFEILQMGWQQTAPQSQYYDLTLEPGEEKEDVDFGNQTVSVKGSISGYKWEDENGNGEKDGEESNLSGWEIVIHPIGEPNDQVQVLANDYDGINSNISLTSGRKYLFEVSGTWLNGSVRRVDAEYYSDNNWGSHYDMEDDPTRGERQLDLVVDNQNINWDSFSPNHIYKAVINGNDAQVNLRVYDEDHDSNPPFWYNDNSGSLTVKIYDVTDEIVVTDENGNYEKEVEPGEYQVLEILQSGWEQTHPQSPGYYHLTVDDSEQVTANFGNRQTFEETSQVTVCKQDQSQNPLEGWKMVLKGEHVGDVNVYPSNNGENTGGTDNQVVESNPLSLEDYVLEANGYYSYRPYTPGAEYTDAVYSKRAPSDAVYDGPYVPWVNVTTFPNPHTGWLGVMVNGVSTNWSNYFAPDHKYALGYPGYSGKFSFTILDDYYSDNSGKIVVSIYKGWAGETGENGCVTFEDVPYGDYSLEEILQSGWEQVDGGGQVSIDEPYENFTLVNRPSAGDLKVCKFNDLDGDGEWEEEGENDEFIEWDINVEGQEGVNIGEDNCYTWEDLPIGTYEVSETEKEGWNLTTNNNPTTAEVKSGETTTVYFGNQEITPSLTVSKSNNKWPTDQAPGNEVGYTITVTALDNIVHNVVVTDLLPGGFNYQSGSWSATKNASSFNIPEPTYASPGTWQLGDMNPGDEVVLSYVAVIDNDQQPGLYKDIAWAYGCSGEERSCSVDNSDVVLATSVDPGTLDSTDNFVGTKINIVKEQQESLSVNIEKEETREGEVLGAATGLPATGAKTIWVILASVFMMLGLSLVTLGISLRKKWDKYLLKLAQGLLTIFLMVFLFASNVHAANLYIRLEQPKSPTNQDNLDLNFVALDMLSRPVTVKCFKKEPSNSSFSQFGSDINLSAGGDTNNCPVTSSLLSDNGTYQFYTTAKAGTDEVSSEIITVDYNTSGPGTPTNYKKDKLASCQYKISFKTADDGGKTVKVEIYRSENTEFTADAGSRVGTIGIGSNQNGEFTDSVPDCGKTYYYAVRAFDGSGNGSGIVGDSVVKVTTVTTTVTTAEAAPSPAMGAIPVTGVTLPTGPTPEVSEEKEAVEGEVLGEGTPSAEEVEETEGTQGITKGLTKKSNLPYIVLALILLGALSYVFYLYQKKE